MSKLQARSRYAAQWLRLLSEKELRMARSAYKILKLDAKVAAAEYEKSGQAAAIKATKELKPTWHRLLVNFYNHTIPTFAEFTSIHISGRSIKMPTFIEAQMAFVHTQGLMKAETLTQTSVDKLIKIISKGIEKGKSQSEIADLIKTNLNGISDWRARTIARTEVHTAASWASQETAVHSGREMVKSWQSVDDERTREDHSDATNDPDNQNIGLDEDFTVGDSTLAYPGDPFGPPEQTINCRCCVIYEPKTFDISDHEYF